MNETITAATVYTGSEEFSPGQVRIRGGNVTAVGPAPASTTLDYPEGIVVPGFVDVHCHGGGGAGVSGDPATVVATHRRHGTTTMVASLVSQSREVLTDQVRGLAPVVRAGVMAGIHLEGPWLSEQFRGAHAAETLRDPDPAEVAALLDAGAGTVRMVTLAAERPGGLASVELLARRGVVAALGHTAADLTVARAAIDAGVTGATHLFNAMPGLHHRAPGPILALLAEPRVWLEIIADGVHLDPQLVAWLARTYPDRVVLITDAMAAAGAPDGEYRLGDLVVTVRDAVARVRGTDTIAGSTLTMDAAIRTVVDAGLPWQQAVRSATVLPACYLGLPGVGCLGPGACADLVVLGAGLVVQAVMAGGVWVA